MPTSVRLDDQSEARLRRLARVTGKSKSALIRDAIERLDRDVEESAELTVFEQIGGSIGLISRGPGERASRSEELLRARFREKRSR
jgi:Arc/MetJ-type ribon-helix-helix transcriptional regulator